MSKLAIPTSALGQFLRTLRDKRGLTQNAMADAIGVEASAISKWELGRSAPGPKCLELLRDFFGVTYTEMGLPALEGTRSAVKLPEEPAPQQVAIELPPQPAVQEQPSQGPQGALPADVQAAIDTILRMPWQARETVVTVLKLSLEKAEYERRLLAQLGGGENP